jgi:hypothetical protein
MFDADFVSSVLSTSTSTNTCAKELEFTFNTLSKHDLETINQNKL